VTAVDADPRASALARRNAETCGAGADYTIETGDVLAVLARLGPAGPFDIIFLDPPYAFARTREVLQAAAAVLHHEGLLVLERATRAEPDVPEPLARMRDIRSGDSSLTLLVRGA
jgi:16S rRNA (guanine966-N2)-methyltransferase